ncbi:uncharacterized protein LOC143282396 [Babylonia areolata]|uniref:uncharacterized protein LOC143282396 n=1 Tax=Babylonia areolata TaxID=304850 RepID=UPI003FD11E4D
MTEASRSRDGGIKGFASFATLGLLVFAMAAWSTGPAEAHYGYSGYSNSYIEARLTSLFYTLSSRISALEYNLKLIGHQECQTGVLNFTTCPGFNDASIADISACIVSPVAGSGTNIIDVTVTFNKPFKYPPVVMASYSALALIDAKNCSLEVLSVAKDRFTLRQVADDFLPVGTEVSYFACPTAFFKSDDKKHDY